MSALLLMLPFFSFIISLTDQTSFYNELSTRQFFHFLADEIHQSTSIIAKDNKFVLEQMNGETVTIEKYSQIIRRLVGGKGHEVMLRDVRQINIAEQPYGFHIRITLVEGDIYEKTISNYK
ncbi:ComGF family competence protein [Aquibacillus koreensis]|uniref:ComGF family competence protein n=1 Tax=Aquibacillus koreensis TaxID=279446 RepID=UPI00233F9B24|nr:ComGF family competence protein [Aquibacillus koreensis]